MLVIWCTVIWGDSNPCHSLTDLDHSAIRGRSEILYFEDLLYRWQIEDSVFVCNYRLYLYVLAVFVGCTEISVLIHFAVNCNFHYRRPPTLGDFYVRSLLVFFKISKYTLKLDIL